MKKCPTCGESSLPDTLKYCYKCKHDFYPQPQTSSSSRSIAGEPTKITKSAISGVSIILVIGCVTLITVAVLFSQSQQREKQSAAFAATQVFLDNASLAITNIKKVACEYESNQYCVEFTITNQSSYILIGQTKINTLDDETGRYCYPSEFPLDPNESMSFHCASYQNQPIQQVCMEIAVPNDPYNYSIANLGFWTFAKEVCEPIR